MLETMILVWPQYNGSRLLQVLWGNGNTSFFEEQDTGDPDHLVWAGVDGEFSLIRNIPLDYSAESACDQTQIQGGFILRQPDGLLYYFCPPSVALGGARPRCYLRKVVDPYGNAISLSRNSGKVSRLTCSSPS